MGFNIYRFEVLKEIARSGANVIYEVKDTSDSSILRLYEWTPLPEEVAAASEKFSQLGGGLEGVEAFANGHHLCVVDSGGGAQKALELLRTHNLFSGVWPGLFEEAGSSVPEAGKVKQTKRSHRVLITALVVLAGLAAAAFWWSRQSSPPPPEEQTTIPENSPTPIPAPSAAPVEIRYFTMDPDVVQPGQNVTLSWEVVNAKEVWLKGLAPQPLLVRNAGRESYRLPGSAQQIELEGIGEGAGNTASKKLDLHHQ